MDAVEVASPAIDPLSRVQRVSRRVATATLCLMVISVLAYGVFWTNETLVADLMADYAGALKQSYVLSGSDWMFGFLISLLPMTLYLLGFLTMWRLFGAFAAGDILTVATGRRIGWIGLLIALLSPVSMLSRTLATLLITLDAGPGQRQLAITISGQDVFGLVVGLLLIVIGWVLCEAARLADENRSFI